MVGTWWIVFFFAQWISMYAALTVYQLVLYYCSARTFPLFSMFVLKTWFCGIVMFLV